MIDGIARGGGCEFLCALDLRIGTPKTLIGQPETALGLIPGAGGTARWPRLIGRGRALDLLLTGRDLTAFEAYEFGWLDRLVETAELENTGREIATRIAALDPAVIERIKLVIALSLNDLKPALIAEANGLATCMASHEHRSAIDLFLAAGGQTRDAERDYMPTLLRAATGEGPAINR